MAAREEELERVVALRRIEHGVRARRARRGEHLALAPVPRALAARVVGEAPARHVEEPAAGVRGHAADGPLLDRGQQRLLHRILGRPEVARAPHERAEHPRREIAQGPLGARVEAVRHAPGSGRTLIT